MRMPSLPASLQAATVSLLTCSALALTGTAGAAVTVNVDSHADVRALSPLIFGVNYGDDARNAQIGYPLRRWGGNSTTRYNWQVDVHSTAADWYFENIPGASDRSQVPPLGNAADAFIGATLGYGADVLLTIPTIGWTPRADSPKNHPYFAGFSVIKYGAQQSTDPWDPDAGDGIRLSNGQPITGNDPTDTSTQVTPSFWQDWINHLKSTFGAAGTGGVRFYALDNEVMLWNSTHRDVHPDPTTYDETWAKALAYGAAIKQTDPSAQVLGPVTWGYCDLFGSGADNCAEGADRDAHGGLPFVAWYLQQVCAHPLAGGARVVDYLDLHYYPQGNNVSMSDDDSAATAQRRLRALKELYDPNWVSESWLSDLGDFDSNHYSKPNLIPRARAWIDQYCPGTKLAITEYRWGNDGTASGAVAQAELFGIFAREGVDMATRWVAPEADTRVERAFTLFLNYDGNGGRVSGNSVRTVSGNVDQVGAYAFVGSGERIMVLLTNKTAATQTVSVNFASSPGAQWHLYGFDTNQGVHAISNGTLAGNSITFNALPAMSANLLVITGDSGLFSDGFEP
ncbi:MAG TPA: glycoside hydrolase family 44 protein [Chiayiivirga sp.]|nr:glycoside hydrolase family 44 protein [Chiayiivirga sp.]